MSDVVERPRASRKADPNKAEASEKGDEPRHLEPPPSGRMGAGTKARARAAAEAVFARMEGGELVAPPAARIDWLVADLDDFLARVRGQTRLVFVLGLFVVSYVGPMMLRAFGSLGGMPLARRVEALSRLEEGPLAPAVLAVKALFCTLYYEHPDAAREVGFDGACLTAARSEGAS